MLQVSKSTNTNIETKSQYLSSGKVKQGGRNPALQCGRHDGQARRERVEAPIGREEARKGEIGARATYQCEYFGSPKTSQHFPAACGGAGERGDGRRRRQSGDSGSGM